MSLLKSCINSCVFLILTLAGCSSNDNNKTTASPSDNALIRTKVTAAQGGTFSSSDNTFSITIPAGALDMDTELVVKMAGSLPMPMDNLSSAGHAYEVSLGAASLAEPATLAVTAEQPIHPQLGEMAVYTSGAWQRLDKNFYRFADNTVISLIETVGVVMPVFRTLQVASGDAVMRGERVFLHETFGNENFFGGVLGLHELLNNLTPAAAVGVGVQVDLSRVPQGIVDVLLGNDFQAKQDALVNPAITRALLQADAVVGVKGVFEEGSDQLISAGITCALCHVNVTPTEFELSAGDLTPLPIGELALNGVPNNAMDAGAILSLTPFAQNAGADTVNFLQSFGPGRFDVRALPDNVLEDNVANPTSFPPLWNFVDLAEQGYMYNWDGLFMSAEEPDNALASQAEAVYDLIMHADGAFGTGAGSIAPELSITPPQALLDALAAAEANAPGNDIDEQSLLDVQAWQRSIVSPAPGDYNEAMAETGFFLFNGKANCGGCHGSAEFTGPVMSTTITLNPPMGGLAEGIKTPGLRGLVYTAPYFHDGSAATLDDVMDIYTGRITPALSEQEKAAVVEYMKSL